MKPRKIKPGLHLALGGGAARGFTHLGIIKVLQKYDIPIAGICGTSMGAVIGASFAFNPNAEQVISYMVDYIKSTHFGKARYAFMQKVKKDRESLRDRLKHSLLVGRSIATGSVISFLDFKSEIESLIPARAFTETRIPFYAVSCDLTQMKEIVFNRGLLRSAVMASAAIPGVFPAVKAGSSIYIDGGWVNKIPVRPLMTFGAEHVLAVDVSDYPMPSINPKRGFYVKAQADITTQFKLQELQTEHASLLWRPPVKSLHWAEFTQIERAVELGINYAEDHIHEIQELLKKPPPLSLWQRISQKIVPPPPRNLPFKPSFEIRGIWEIEPAETT